MAQPRGPVVSLPNTLTEIERRDYLASTDNDHSEANYEEANFRQTGIRSVGLLYDTKSE